MMENEFLSYIISFTLLTQLNPIYKRENKMQLKKLALICLPALLLAGCQAMDANTLVNLGAKSLQAASLDDGEIRALSDKSCQQMDGETQIAPANSAYTTRLNKIAKRLGNNINGVPVNYKVYMTKDVNAWAMANGCIRVYSGLMDLMTDNEVEGILGHEMGHVALGHTKKAMQVAYGTAIARDVIASTTSGVVAALTQSQIGDLTQKIINSQFSQTQELAADNYSFDFLTSKKIAPQGLVTSFEKLAKISGDQASIISTHPSSKKRADNIRQRIAASK